MAEFNPYKLEEEKWTPNNVYEILPPNAVSWSDYEFGQGTDNVDQEAANKSLIDGFVDFFKEIFSTAGKILGGAVELGGAVLGGFVNGVVSLIGGIARAVGSIFGGGNNQNAEPPEPIFNPIKTNLEGAIQPHLDDIAEAKEKIDAAYKEQEKIKEDIESHGRDLSTALSKAEKGIADAKIAQDNANKAISDIKTKSGELTAEIEAQREAAIARESALKEEINPKIEAAQSRGDSAMSEAQKAIENAEFIAGFADDLIPKDAEGKSTWGSSLEPGDVSPPESAFGSERTYIMSSSTTAPEPFVPVKGQEVYRLTLWVKEHPDSSDNEVSFHLKSATGYAGWTHVRMDFGQWKTEEEMPNPYALVSSDKWDKYTVDFRWPESAGPAYLQINQDSVGKFYIHDPQVRVIAPVDNSVDLAQNEVLRAHAEILRQQQEINTLNTAFQEEQKVINATKNELDTLQNEAIKANSKVGETNTTAIEALETALDSVEQIIGLDNAYRTQQEEIDRQQDDRQRLLEKIQKLQGQMIQRTILYENEGEVFDDYVEISPTVIKAKDSWVGQMVVTRAYSYKDSEGVSQRGVSQSRYSVPHLGSREITRTSGDSSTRVDYWVYPGVSKKLNLTGHSGYISGESFRVGEWGFVGSFEMPENEGMSTIQWETRLTNADRGVTYRLRLLVNGVEKKNSWWSGRGPLFPWGSGVSYLRPTWELEIPAGATVRIEGAADGSPANSTRAQASHNKGVLTWTESQKEMYK